MKRAIAIFGALFLPCSTFACVAEPILQVNIYDLSMVKFVGTGAVSMATNEYGYAYSVGFNLRNFFTDAITASSALGGDLAPAQGSITFNEISVNFGTSLKVSRDVVSSMSFQSGSPAFSGTGTGDLSGFSFLPSVGTTGIVEVDGEKYGTYEVIPEPSSLLFGMFGAIALGFAGWRRQRAL